MAYGWGWTEKRLDKTSPKVIFQTWKGRNDERNKSGDWERLRILCATLINVNSKKKVSAKQFLPLPWDAPPETREQWLQRNKHLNDAWDKLEKAGNVRK